MVAAWPDTRLTDLLAPALARAEPAAQVVDRLVAEAAHAFARTGA